MPNKTGKAATNILHAQKKFNTSKKQNTTRKYSNRIPERENTKHLGDIQMTLKTHISETFQNTEQRFVLLFSIIS